MRRFDDKYDEGKEADRRMKEIILSTGNINRSYVVRDVIYVAEKFTVDLFDAEVNVDEAMDAAKVQLLRQQKTPVVWLATEVFRSKKNP